MKRPGFTLVELMVAISVSSILIASTVSVYTLIRNSISRDTMTADLAQNARVALDRLTRELRQTPDVVTPLPADTSDISVAQPNEIEFEDGHANDLSYRRYAISGTTLQLEVKEYTFANSPGVRVKKNSVSNTGASPVGAVLSTQDVAENVSAIRFWDGASGTELTMEIVTSDGVNQIFTLRSTVQERN